MKSLRRLLPLPLLPVILVPVILLGPMLITGKVLFWGTPALQFIPWRSFGWELLASGHPPLWNPLVGMGAPLAANYQTAFFYPPNWIEALFWALGGISWQAWAQTMLVMLHLILSGLGASLLVRRLGVGLLGQTIAGIAFGCSGYLVARAGFLSINAAVAWLPWILLGTWLIIAGPGNRKAWIGLVFALAMQLLTGHAQTVWYSYLLAFLWVGFWGWRKAIDGVGKTPSQTDSGRSIPGKVIRSVIQSWAYLSLAIVLAIGLAAIQLIPTAEYLMQSQRASAVDYELAMTYSFWPWRIIGLFAPNFFGNPAHGDFWGYGNFWEDALYIGLLPVLLALSVLLRPGAWPNLQAKNTSQDWPEKPLQLPAIRRSLVYFLWMVLIVGFILALGKNTPAFPWLYWHIPTFSLFNAPSRFLIWIEISLVLLASMGADRWRRPEKKALYWTRLATAGGFAVSLGAGLAWFLVTDTQMLSEVTLSAIGATAIAGLWGLLAGGLSLLAPESQTTEKMLYKSPGQHLWLWAVIFTVGLDLLIAGWGLNPGVELNFYSEKPANLAQVTGLSDGGRLYLPEEAEKELKFERFFRFDTFFPGEDWHNLRTVYLPDLNMVDGLASANNFDPLLSGRYARWMEQLAQTEASQRADWLNLMAVSVVETVDASLPDGVRFESIASGSKTTDERSNARIRWVPCADFSPDEESTWELMTSDAIDFETEVVVEQQSTELGKSCFEAGPASVQIELETPSRIVLQVDARYPGWLVLADQWYPGWVGSIDGRPVEIRRANYLFRAIQVGAGKHRVEFLYRPVSFLSGAGITACVSFAFLVVGWWLRRRNK